jgi:hypothetical protein
MALDNSGNWKADHLYGSANRYDITAPAPTRAVV